MDPNLPAIIPTEVPAIGVQAHGLTCYNFNMSFLDSVKSFIQGKSYSGLISGNLPSGRRWGSGDYLKANEISLYTNRALAKRKEKVGEIEFVIKNRKTEEVIDEHPLYGLLTQPNRRYTASQFWGLYQNYIDIMGSAYIVMDMPGAFEREFGEEKRVNELHLLRPDQVTPKFDRDGMVTHFEHRTNGNVTEYQAGQVIYIFNPDPNNPLKGMSLLKAGITAIQTEVQIGAYHSNVLENGGKVEGVFKFKTPRLTREQLQNLEDGYDKKIADARKSGKPLFLGGDADYIKTGLTPDELSYLEAKKATLEDIVIMTGVPKPLLASYDDIQYSNADAAIRVFLRETIKPLLKALAESLDKRLGDTNAKIDFVDPTPENVEEKKGLLEAAKTQGLITTNEGRQVLAELMGIELEDVDNGDDILIPFNLIPLGDQSTMSDGKSTDKESGSKKKENGSEEEKEHPLRDPAVRRVYEKIVVKRADVRERLFRKVLKQYTQSQRDRIIEMLDPGTKHVFRKKGLLDEVLNLEVELEIGKEKFLPTVTELLILAGQEAYALAESAYEFNITAEMTSWLERRSNVFLRQINQTTYNKLKEEFAESLANGESRPELIKRVEKTYGDIEKSRAKTIARTEVHNVTQYGILKGYEQAGLTIKIWVTVGDFSVRDSHASQDGEERPINSPFSNGLMYPGEENGSPEEVINCRCSI
jgi:HK97 family phage portal protein